jgi:integrase
MATIIGLMAATGLRPAEIYRLGPGQVDLDSAHLAVMHSKHGKRRQIPLHVTTVDGLGPLKPPERPEFHRPAGAGFFLTASSRDLTSELAAGCFRHLVRTAGIDRAMSAAPRPGWATYATASRCIPSARLAPSRSPV